MESIAKLNVQQIAISHFNDAPADPPPHTQRDPDRVMPGDGAIDLKRYCETAEADRIFRLRLTRTIPPGPVGTGSAGSRKDRPGKNAIRGRRITVGTLELPFVFVCHWRGQ